MNCPICHSSDTSIFLEGLNDFNFNATQEKFNLLACKRCDAKFQYPFIPESEVGKYYPASSYQPFRLNHAPIQLAWKYNAQSIYLRALHERYQKEDQFSLIDVGFGGGTFLMSVKYYFPNAVLMGIDVSETAIDNLKSIGIEGVCGSLYNFDAQRTFDYIVSSQVLEHLNQPYLFLKTLEKLAHADTQIMIDVPATDSFTAKQFGRNWTHWDPPRHSILYSEITLKYLFKDFKTLQIRHAGSMLAILSSYKVKRGKSPLQPIFPLEQIVFGIAQQIGKLFKLHFLFDDKLIWIGKIK